MKFPTATRRDHEKFCVTEGWTQRTTAAGQAGTHHHNFELTLPDGRMLYTRISHPINRADYGPGLWSHILRDQLEVDNPVFWDCVKHGVLPDRGGPSGAPENAIPAGVVSILLGTFHLPEEEVRAMTTEQAITRMGELFSRPPLPEGDATTGKD